MGFETALLAVFCAIILAGPPVTSVSDRSGIVAGLFAAMAMGMQAVIVRLLMRGVPQTNVMTGNLTQIGIETTDLVSAWINACATRPIRKPSRELDAVRARLFTVLADCDSAFWPERPAAQSAMPKRDWQVRRLPS